MARSTTIIDTGKRVFSNLKYLYFRPWTSDSAIGTQIYDLVNIVGDSTSVEQADNDVQSIEHEFSNKPLYENIQLGKKTFTCECIDFQNDVLKNLFGWEVSEGGDAAAPLIYKDLYVLVEMGFNSTNDVVVLPKVKINSKAVLSTMKTDASRGTITGTCYSAYVKAGTFEKETDEAVVAAANVDTYTVSATQSGS